MAWVYRYSAASLANRVERANPEHIASLLGLEFRENGESQMVKRQIITALKAQEEKQ